MEILKFIFSDFWVFCGACFLIALVGHSLAAVVAAWRSGR